MINIMFQPNYRSTYATTNNCSPTHKFSPLSKMSVLLNLAKCAALCGPLVVSTRNCGPFHNSFFPSLI